MHEAVDEQVLHPADQETVSPLTRALASPPSAQPLRAAASWANRTQGSSEGAADWPVEPGQNPAPTLMLSLLLLPCGGNWPLPSRTVYSASNPLHACFRPRFHSFTKLLLPPRGPASRHRAPSSYAATRQVSWSFRGCTVEKVYFLPDLGSVPVLREIVSLMLLTRDSKVSQDRSWIDKLKMRAAGTHEGALSGPSDPKGLLEEGTVGWAWEQWGRVRAVSQTSLLTRARHRTEGRELWPVLI